MVVITKLAEKIERQIEQRPLPPANAAVGRNQPAYVPPEYQAIIEEGLRLVYSQHYRLASRLYPDAAIPLALDQLLQGPLAKDLTRLAQIAVGMVRIGREETLGAIDSVLQLLFWPVASETYSLPRSFWQSPLGQMLMLAKLRSFRSEELLTIGQTSDRLRVSRATIYRWMDDRILDYVLDALAGRTYVVRQDVEALLANVQEDGGEPGTAGSYSRYITETPGVVGGYPAIAGTRTPVRAIIETFREDPDVGRILQLYPHLTFDQVLAALDYYEVSPARVDEDIATNEQAIRELRGQ